MTDETNALLERAQSEMLPTEAARARMRARLFAPRAPAAPQSSPVLTTKGLTLLGVGVAIVGTAAVLFFADSDSRPSAPRAPAVERAPRAAPAVDPPARIEAPTEVWADEDAAGERPIERSTPERPRVRPRAGESDSADTLARETAILERAMRAIAQDDRATAIRALEQHRAEFPDGVLADSRHRLQERLRVESDPRRP